MWARESTKGSLIPYGRESAVLWLCRGFVEIDIFSSSAISARALNSSSLV